MAVKASRRYHGNHQEKNMSLDEAPYEAFVTHSNNNMRWCFLKMG